MKNNRASWLDLFVIFSMYFLANFTYDVIKSSLFSKQSEHDILTRMDQRQFDTREVMADARKEFSELADNQRHDFNKSLQIREKILIGIDSLQVEHIILKKQLEILEFKLEDYHSK